MSTILVGDNRVTIPTIERESVQCIATSPPYFGLRLYGNAGEEIGKESALGAYVASIVDVMRECRRVLRDDGVAWVNLGDSYNAPGGHSDKLGKSGLTNPEYQASKTERGTVPRVRGGPAIGNALLVPFRVAAALQADGWTLRAMLPWIKIASMPESVQSRPCVAHEYVLFLTKRASGYFYDADAVRVAHCEAVQRQYQQAAARGMAGVGTGQKGASPDRNDSRGGSCGTNHNAAINPSGRSLRSSDFWRAGAREAATALLAAADGEAVGMLTNDDHPAAFVVNPKGSGIAHFAMWPARLVAPMIVAGTPEAGSCSVCGAPWERVVESRTEAPDYRKSNAPIRHMASSAAGQGQTRLDASNLGMVRRVETRGFRPSCACNAPARPARILDPFAGAGTTLAVAECLGREAIGCELYQKNADLYPERREIIRAEVAEYLRERAEGDKAAAIDSAARGQLDMFGSAVKS